MARSTLADLIFKGEAGYAASYNKGQKKVQEAKQQQFENKLKLQQLANEARRIAESERSNRAIEEDRDLDRAQRATSEANEQSRFIDRLNFDKYKLDETSKQAMAALRAQIENNRVMAGIHQLNADTQRMTAEARAEQARQMAEWYSRREDPSNKPGTGKVAEISNSDKQFIYQEFAKNGIPLRLDKKTGRYNDPNQESVRNMYNDVLRLASQYEEEDIRAKRPRNQQANFSKAVSNIFAWAQAEGTYKPATTILGQAFGEPDYETPSQLTQYLESRQPVNGGADPRGYSDPRMANGIQLINRFTQMNPDASPQEIQAIVDQIEQQIGVKLPMGSY